MDEQKIPSRKQYIETCTRLIEEDHVKTLITVRMGCEMGMTRLEIVNAKVSNLNINYDGGLWVDIAKHVKCGKDKDGKVKYKMRSRDIPVNPSLYMVLTSYIEDGQVYILRRKIGDWNTPFHVHYINDLYHRRGVWWTTHASRHFFKNIIVDWMRKNRQIDYPVCKSLMGHSLGEGHDSYGSVSWHYKREVVDGAFEYLLSDEYGKYENLVGRLSSTLDVPINKIKLLYKLFDDFTGGARV